MLRKSSRALPTHRARRELYVEGVLVLAVAVIAVAFRLHRLAMTPPGLHHDEAVNGLDVVYTIPQSSPIFFEMNNGREPLFIYLQALAVQLLGETPLALRVTSAVLGVLTVLATYWLGREWFGRRVAVLAGIGLATSFWHVDLSRVGLRAISVPLFMVLTLGLLSRGLNRGRLASFALAGLTIGLGFYTYISARLVPLVVAAIIAWEAVRGGRHVANRWRGLLVLVAVAAAVSAPLGAYFAEHPEFLIGRSEQVSILNPEPSIEGEQDTFRSNLRNTLGMFVLRGDENPRHNLPGRPVFDPAAAPWFALGLAVALWRAAESLGGRRRSDGRVEPTGWLLIWVVGGLALGALTYESPNFLRLTLMVPAVYVVWGLGVATAWRWIDRRLLRLHVSGRAAGSVLVALLLLYECGLTYRDYFLDWASRGEVYRAFDAGLTAAARYVEDAANAETPLFLHVDRSPPIQFLSRSARQARWLQEYSNLLLLPSTTDGGALYVFAGDGSLSRSPQLYFQRSQPDATDVDADGRTGFVAYRLSPSRVESLAVPETPLGVSFGGADDGVELLGYSLDSPTAQPGDRVGLTLVWRVLADGKAVYAPYVHVIDEEGRSWGQDDRMGYEVGGWRKGDLFLSRHEWRVPVDAPPLTYQLAGGMAIREFGWPPGPAEALGAPVTLAQAQVQRSPDLAQEVEAPAVGRRLDADAGGGLSLIGCDVTEDPLKPGERLDVDLLWRAREALDRDVVVRIGLVDEAGRVLAERSGRPAYGRYPTTRWPAGTVLRDPRALTVPGDAPGGSSRLELTTLDSATDEVLGRVSLGTVEIVVSPREYRLPPMQRSRDVDFGGEIALRGFDLDKEVLTPTDTLRLTLYWQALRAPSKNYTVFTHLLDAANQVVAQQDNPPVRGTVPTLGWAPGQVVRDEYELRLRGEPQRGELVLEVGLYDATTGERLRLADDSDDRVILARLPIVSGEE